MSFFYFCIEVGGGALVWVSCFIVEWDDRVF